MTFWLWGWQTSFEFDSKTQYLGNNSFVNHIIFYGKASSHQEILACLYWSWNTTKQKINSLASPPWWKPCSHVTLTLQMSYDDFNFFHKHTVIYFTFVQLKFMIHNVLFVAWLKVEVLVLPLPKNRVWKLEHLGVKLMIRLKLENCANV